jgi:thioredoxin reductase (NADPH)
MLFIDRFAGNGVSYCIVCDGPLFESEVTAVVGGGGVAVDGVIFLGPIASKVFSISRKCVLVADFLRQRFFFQNEELGAVISLMGFYCKGFIGCLSLLDGVRTVKYNKAYAISILLGGLFVMIGHKPNSLVFNRYIKTNSKGYIENMNQNPGGKVLAAGDVTDKTFKQAITSAASGCVVASKIIKLNLM